MASPPHLDLGLDSKLGAAFLGGIAAAIFYGITSVQTYIFFKGSETDKRPLQVLILFLWILDTLHLALVTHGLYFYMVSNFAHPLALAAPSWSFLSQVYVTCISDLIVRGIFAHRVWLLSGKKYRYFSVSLIAIFSLLTATTGFVFASRVFALGSFRAFRPISWLMYTALSSGVAADFVITASLVTILFRSRTGFKRTDSLLNTLMLYTINTGLFTTICTGLCFITYVIWPAEFIFMGFYFCLSTLYLNALLATLNARSSLREKQYGVSTVPLELSAWNTSSALSVHPTQAPSSHDEILQHSGTPCQELIIAVDQKIQTVR
ncbi:DUF6534 domain-containing protein [Pleurotus pulmonarius]